MIDPLERWRQYGEKPDYAGLLTYGGAPYTQDPAELAGFDVAIVGAPTDDLVSDRPGARFGPRAIRAASCPPGPHLESKVDAFEELKIVDFGDAAVLPADAARSHAAIEQLVGQVCDAGLLPIVLGGDHSIAEPDVRAVAARRGPVGLVHFDTHTDTGREVFGVELSHGTPMFRLVEAGHVDPRRYVQIGLRGYWPGESEFAWQREQGITSFFMHDVRELGIEAVVERTVELVGEGPVYLTVDVDVLDPAFAPGTGTPEPGGMTSGDLLWACREVARRLEVVGAEVVEVIPTAVGSADVTALVADRIVREILNGLVWPVANVADKRQPVPEPGEGAADDSGRDRRPGGHEEDVRDQEHDRRHPDREEGRAGDGEPVGRLEHLLLVALAPAQPMVRRRSNQQDRGGCGGEKRHEEDVALQLGDAGPAVRKGHGQQEREQHLHAREHDAQLVQQLDQLAVEVLGRARCLPVIGTGRARRASRARGHFPRRLRRSR